MKFLSSTSPDFSGKTIFLIVLSIVWMTLGSNGQTGSVSPYSRYGIGELKNQGFSHHRAAGGIVNAWDDEKHINPVNSATLVYDTTTTFEVGLDAEWVNIRNSNTSTNSSSGTFGYFALAFPVVRHTWSAAFGLQPVSSTGYEVSVSEFRDGIGDLQFDFEGEGGISKVFLNNGFKILPGLSFGVSTQFLFGTIENIKSVEYPRNEDYFNTRYIDAVTANDFQFDASLHYRLNLRNKKQLQFGLTASIPSELTARRNVYWYNYTTSAFGFELIKDSVSTISDEKGSISMPVYYRFGALYKGGDSWLVGADLNYMDWSRFEKFGIKDSLSNSYSMHLGGVYKREGIRFMAGLQYSKSFLELRDQQLDDISATFGISLVKLFSVRPPVFINLAFQAGRRGTTDKDLIEENYTRFTFGITISDIWFIKPKYD